MSKMKMVNKDVYEILKIAYLYSMGMTYVQISEYFKKKDINISAASVGRKINQAKENGWILDKVIFNLPDDLKDVQEYFISNPALEEKILSRSEINVDKITIVPTGLDLRDTLRNVARATARLLEAKTTDADVLAANWGYTVSAVAEELRPERKIPGVTVLPIFGVLGISEHDPKHHIAQNIESNNNASIISQKFSGHDCHVKLSFRAIIPAEFTHKESDLEIITRYIESNFTYKQIFGENGKIYQATTLLSSIGSLNKETAWFRIAELSGQTNIKQEFDILTSEGIVGDIGQQFTTIQGFKAPPSKVVANINSRIIGLNAREHFTNIVELHRKDPRGLGLVIASAGKYKAQITIAAMKSGINHLVIDEELAEEILRILDDKKGMFHFPHGL